MKVHLLYVGRDPRTRDHLYYEVEAGELGRSRLFSKKLPGANIGQVLECEIDDGSVPLSSCKFLEIWHDTQSVIKWSLQDQAIREAQSKSREVNSLRYEGLDPYRQVYQNLTRQQRAMLLGRIVEYITA
jgi:hypothetical protein